ncbi:DEAD/DEAH box helicase, partial [archaeon]
VPPAVVAAYAAARVHTLHAWQAECLAIDACAPLLGGNLVYCAPTSGGKTLVAELLMLRTLLLRRRKVLFIVPFVSLCVEKAGHLQRVWRALGLRIQGFYNNRGGASLHNVDVAVCTIERACGLLNRLLMEGRLDDVGMVVIDEAHMVSDATRGYKLELTIMKLLLTGMPERVRATIRATTAQIREFVATQRAGGAAATGAAVAGVPAPLPRHLLEHNIDKLANAPFTQLVMMSATMSNVADLARWVCGSLYICHTRPVQLFETIVVDGVQYNKHLQPLRVFQHPTRMPEHPHIDEMYVRVARVVATPAAVSASDFDVARAARPGELSIAQLAPDRAALAFSRFSAPPAFTASAHVLLPWLCMETASTGRNVLVFAASRRSAERLAQNIAASMAAVTTQPAIDMCLSLRLRLARSRAARLELKDKLRYSPSGADPALSALLLQGVAYHHGGMCVCVCVCVHVCACFSTRELHRRATSLHTLGPPPVRPTLCRPHCGRARDCGAGVPRQQPVRIGGHHHVGGGREPACAPRHLLRPHRLRWRQQPRTVGGALPPDGGPCGACRPG